MSILAVLVLLAIWAAFRPGLMVGPPPVLYDDECTVRSLRFTTPRGTYLDVPFELELVAEGVAPRRPRGTCLVTVRVEEQKGTVAVSDPVVRVDLARERPRWSLTPRKAESVWVNATVESQGGCTRSCQRRTFPKIQLEITQPTAEQEAQERLEKTLDSHEIEVAKGPPLNAGNPGKVQVEVRLHNQAALSAMKNVKLGVRMVRPQEGPADPETVSAGREVYVFDQLVTVPQATDSAIEVEVELTGTWRGIPMSAKRVDTLPVDVKERSWFERYVVDHAPAWGALVGLPGVVFGAMLAYRKVRRRDGPAPQPEPDDD